MMFSLVVYSYTIVIQEGSAGVDYIIPPLRQRVVVVTSCTPS